MVSTVCPRLPDESVWLDWTFLHNRDSMTWLTIFTQPVLLWLRSLDFLYFVTFPCSFFFFQRGLHKLGAPTYLLIHLPRGYPTYHLSLMDTSSLDPLLCNLPFKFQVHLPNPPSSDTCLGLTRSRYRPWRTKWRLFVIVSGTGQLMGVSSWYTPTVYEGTLLYCSIVSQVPLTLHTHHTVLRFLSCHGIELFRPIHVFVSITVSHISYP